MRSSVRIMLSAAALAVIVGAGVLLKLLVPAGDTKQAAALPAPVTAGEGVGAPRSDLTAAELAAFQRGREVFRRYFDVKDGLGPYYNFGSCESCHNVPNGGGSGDMATRIFLAPPQGPGQDNEEYQERAIPGFTPLVIPANASRRLPPPLYGLGLIDKIPDEVLVAKGCNGGSLHYYKGHVARFGTPTFAGQLREFIAGALKDEMGITNHVEPDFTEGSDKGVDQDKAADPEINLADSEDLVAYVAGLAPPPRLASEPAGEALFNKTFQCARCHRPETAPGVQAFTDLCMHSMGTDMRDGIIAGGNVDKKYYGSGEEDGDEYRTKPLWGLRLRAAFLHDGRAVTVDEAIRLHGGEAADASKLYSSASEQERRTLLAFLQTL